MGYVESGKWTCPSCGRTVVVIASDADTVCCLEAVQKRHAHGHEAAAAVLSRLGLPDPHPRRRR
jgi:uncharacterized Zn finger protein (UPF0148 family)